MFEKLLSVLPYSPGLTHQLAFYSRRMREEAAIRRTGLVFIILAFFVQFFAVLSPPQSTSAASNNDLINGGFTSAAEAAKYCNDNTQHYGDILQDYGISCSDVSKASTVSLKSTADNRQLYSMGRLPYSLAGETPVNVQGTTYYFRFLWGWDTGGPSTYKALKVTGAGGQTLYLLYNCGNLVSIGLPQQVSRCQYNSNLLSTSPDCFKPCQYDSSIAASSAQCFKPCQYNKNIAASSSQCAAPCQYDKSILSTSPKCFKPCQYNSSIAASSSQCFAHCPIPGKTNLPKTSSQCAAACPYNSSIAASSTQCFQPCQYNASIAADSPSCAAPCQYNGTILSTSSSCFQSCQYNSSIAADSPSCFQPCQYNASIAASSPDCYQPCQYNSAIASSDSQCKPCEQSLSSQDTSACVVVHKTASDPTAGITNANGITANPGDVIVYTLSADNTGKATVAGYTFQEDLSDVMDYADPTDLHGGSLSSDDVVSWPALDIAPGQTATEQITVKVKNPVPQTPVDPGDPGHFDLTMTNVYGDTINIHVPGSPAKTIETTAAGLPNTGPGDSLFVAVIIVALAGFFYSRSRLLQEESTIAVQEAANA